MSRTPIRISRNRWRLLALSAVVLSAHVWLLASPLLPASDAPPPASDVRALQTRTVVLAPAAPQAVPTALPQAPAPPRVSRPKAPSSPNRAPASLAPVQLEIANPPSDAPTDPPPNTPLEAPPSVPAVDLAPPALPASVTPPDEPVAVPTADEATTVALATDAAAIAPPAKVPFAPPPSAHLAYEVKVAYRGVPQTLQGTLDWQQDGRRYRMHMAIEMLFLGSRVQHSEGHLGAYGLAPERFSEKTRSERAAHFDEAGARIRYSANTADAPLLPSHQDRLSVFMQLAGLVHARPEHYPVGQKIHIPTTGVRDSETWTFEVLGTQAVDLPKGDVAALHLRRLPRKEFDTTVEVWLAPSMGHLPVRMRLTQSNGDVADQRLITP